MSSLPNKEEFCQREDTPLAAGGCVVTYIWLAHVCDMMDPLCEEIFPIIWTTLQFLKKKLPYMDPQKLNIVPNLYPIKNDLQKLNFDYLKLL